MNSHSFEMPTMTFRCMFGWKRKSFTRVFIISPDESMHLSCYSFFLSLMLGFSISVHTHQKKRPNTRARNDMKTDGNRK